MSFEEVPELINLGTKQPRALQILMSMAVESLNPRQKEIWFLHNNERLTQDEIALHFNVDQTTICEHIRAIETKLTKYIKANMGAYLLLKVEKAIMEDD